MKNEFITIKTTKNVLSLLRMACALTGEKQYELLERMLNSELKKQ